MGITNFDNKNMSGSGVIVVEDYICKSGESQQCILFVRNAATRTYSDFGGSYEKSDINIAATATKELREESRNLFILNPADLTTYCDIYAGNNLYYRTFIVKINGVHQKYFGHNKKIIDKTSMRHCWKETDAIVHIPIHNINLSKHTNMIKNVHGNEIKISSRTKKILYNCMSVIGLVVSGEPILTKKNININKNGDDMHLRGTVSFVKTN